MAEMTRKEQEAMIAELRAQKEVLEPECAALQAEVDKQIGKKQDKEI